MVSDDFNRANANPASGNWTHLQSPDNDWHRFRIVSNQLVADSDSNSGMVENAHLWNDEQTSGATIDAVASGNCGFLLNFDPVTGNGYACVGNFSTKIYKVVGFAFGSPKQDDGPGWNEQSGAVVTFRRVGNTLSVLIDGAQSTSWVDDDSPYTGGAPGIYNYGPSNTIDDWFATGEIAPPETDSETTDSGGTEPPTTDTGSSGSEGGGASAAEVWNHEIEPGFTAGALLQLMAAVLLGRTTIDKLGGSLVQVDFYAVSDQTRVNVSALMDGSERQSLVYDWNDTFEDPTTFQAAVDAAVANSPPRGFIQHVTPSSGDTVLIQASSQNGAVVIEGEGTLDSLTMDWSAVDAVARESQIIRVIVRRHVTEFMQTGATLLNSDETELAVNDVRGYQYIGAHTWFRIE